jgi:hypothetical protein
MAISIHRREGMLKLRRFPFVNLEMTLIRKFAEFSDSATGGKVSKFEQVNKMIKQIGPWIGPSEF